jgi:hypothetical protein
MTRISIISIAFWALATFSPAQLPDAVRALQGRIIEQTHSAERAQAELLGREARALAARLLQQGHAADAAVAETLARQLALVGQWTVKIQGRPDQSWWLGADGHYCGGEAYGTWHLTAAGELCATAATGWRLSVKRKGAAIFLGDRRLEKQCEEVSLISDRQGF